MNHPPAFIAEQHVQFAARHFLRRGDVVYDVGANRGWLTVSFSRLVGTGGHVACFEASPRNIGILSSLVLDYRLANVEVIGNAVYQESGLTLDLFENPFSNTDSLYFEGSNSRRVMVRTITLDDYYNYTSLSPSLVKMDIEGAEYDALVGGKELIKSCKPIFLLEMRKTDLRPFAFLTEFGYRAFNLKTFEELREPADFEDGGIVEDILFMPESRMNTPEAAFLETAAGRSFTAIEATAYPAGKMVLCVIPVEAGISCVRIFSKATGNPSIACSVVSGGRCVVRSDAGYYLICEPHLSFTVYSHEPDVVVVCIQVMSDDPAIELLRVETKTIPFDDRSHRHHRTLNLVQPFGTPTEELLPLLEHLLQERHNRAFSCLADQIRRSDPNNPRFLYFSGVNSIHSGQPEAALHLFEQALLFGFDPFWTHYMRAITLRMLGRPVEARDAAAMADQANPGHPEVRRILGELDEICA